MPVGVDVSGDPRVHADHATAFADLEYQPFGGDECGSSARHRYPLRRLVRSELACYRCSSSKRAGSILG